VFALHQTEGAPLPEVAPALLVGQAPAGLWDDLASQVTGYGYAVERGECAGANGYTDPTRRVVRVRDDIDEAQAVKVLAHDLLTAPTPRFVRSWQGVAQGTRRPCSPSLSCGSCTAGLVASDSRGVTMEFNEANGVVPSRDVAGLAAETVTKAARTILSRCSADPAASPNDLAGDA